MLPLDTYCQPFLSIHIQYLHSSLAISIYTTLSCKALPWIFNRSNTQGHYKSILTTRPTICRETVKVLLPLSSFDTTTLLAKGRLLTLLLTSSVHIQKKDTTVLVHNLPYHSMLTNLQHVSLRTSANGVCSPLRIHNLRDNIPLKFALT